MSKFAWVSYKDYADYMKCQNVGMILRNVKITEKPDLTLESDGDSHTLTRYGPLKTIKISFTVGVPFEADMGYDQKLSYIATFENDALTFQQVDGPVRDVYQFSSSGVKVTSTAADGTVFVDCQVYKRA
eukprot:gene22211-30451_t